MSAVGSAVGQMAQQVLKTGVTGAARTMEQTGQEFVATVLEKQPLSFMGTLRGIGSYLYGWGKYLREGGMGLISKFVGFFKKAPVAEDPASFVGAHI